MNQYKDHLIIGITEVDSFQLICPKQFTVMTTGKIMYISNTKQRIQLLQYAFVPLGATKFYTLGMKMDHSC